MEQVEIFEKLSVVEARNRKAHDMDFVRTPSPFECTHLRQTHWIFAILTFPNRIASETPNPETIGSLPERKTLDNRNRMGKRPSNKLVQRPATEYRIAQPLQSPVVTRNVSNR